jgi:hypothetical protein
MPMFNFSQKNNPDSGSGSLVSPNFWIYWAGTLPLTCVVILVGRLYIATLGHDVAQEHESLKMEKNLAGQRRSIVHVSENSPMYIDGAIAAHPLHGRLSSSNGILVV